MPARPKFRPTNADQKLRVRRILAIYSRATDAEREEGLNWYATANTFAQGLSRKHKVTIRQAAGIVAALSPQVTWDQNQVLAETLLRTGKAANQTRINVRKANSIRSGTDPSEALRSESSPNTGHKVRAFFACIESPDTAEEVCVDRHAFDLCEGLLVNTKEGRGALSRIGVYRGVADAYREAARVLGIRPHQVQAVTWVVWRNLKREVNVPTFGQVA